MITDIIYSLLMYKKTYLIQHGFTALMCAVRCGNIQVIRLLTHVTIAA